MTPVETALIDRIEGDRTRDHATQTLEDRIVSATLRCIARWGINKTTLDDIAREARCSRASVYRVFPGGKDVLLDATWRRELTVFFAELAVEIDRAETLEDAIVLGITEACRAIAGHDALQYLVAHEPGAILPWVAFDGLDPLLQWSAAFAVPRLERFLPPSVASVVGPWAARIVVSYGFEPYDTTVDLTDEAVARRFVRTYLIPGIAQMSPDSLSTIAIPANAVLPANRETSTTTQE